MTTVVTLANMPATATDVAIKLLDQTKLRLKSSGPVQGGVVSEYIYADGDATLETSVSVRSVVDAKTGIVRSSIRLKTQQVVTTDSVITESAPVEVILSWNTPGASEDPAALLAMLGSAFSLSFDSLVSKVPQTGTISAINRGLTADLF